MMWEARAFLFTLPDRVLLAWRIALDRLDKFILALIDSHLHKRGEHRAILPYDFDDLPVLHDITSDNIPLLRFDDRVQPEDYMDLTTG